MVRHHSVQAAWHHLIQETLGWATLQWVQGCTQHLVDPCYRHHFGTGNRHPCTARPLRTAGSLHTSHCHL